ncbi:MAG: GNAT family protein [Chitinophagia bacterium]
MHTNLIFDTSADLILEDERVLLRPLVQEDIVHLSAYVHEEPTLWNFALTPIKTEQEFEQYITSAVESRRLNTAYPFIVFDKVQNKFVGSTRFYDLQLNHSSTQLGYTWYSESTWGTGLNEHCKLLLLTFAFETIGFERVEFRADNRNKRSIAAMQKIGCTIEGVLRNHLPTSDGTRRDSIVLSMLKEEWPTIKAGFLARIKMQDQNK